MSFQVGAGGRLIAVLGVLCFASGFSSVDPSAQYKTYLTQAQTIDPVGDFGEQISLREGKLSFRNVDIEVPGNGPTIRIVRTAQLDEGYGKRTTSGNAVGGWEIEIPRLKTITADPDPVIHANFLNASSPIGWQVPGADMNARCENFGIPPTVSYGNTLVEFYPANWWFGYQLVDDAGNEHTVTTRAAGLPGPQYTLGTTTGHWVIACLPQTSNGEPGDAFQAISPDGTKYWLDRLTYSDYAGLTMAFAEIPPKDYTYYYDLPRKSAAMMVTRVEDRFGNWLKYNYSGSRVTSIEASDGREVTLDWQTDGLTITVGAGSATRTWTYAASGGDTMQVVQPDGSKWQYAGDFHMPHTSNYSSEGCSQGGLGYEQTGTREVSVSAPSGATATFFLKQRFFGRAYVPKYCSESPSWENPDAGYALYAKAWVSYAMDTKTVAGPGLPTMVWNYSYSPHNAAWLADCPNNSCPDEVWTDVTDPNGDKVRSTFSNRWDQTENKLLREDFYDGGQVLRTQTYTYATAPSNGPNPYPWPLFVAGFTNYNANPETDQRWTPVKQKVVTQQGTTYTWQANSYDEWSNPLSVTRSSAPGGHSRTDVAAYHHNLTKWVIGQAASSTNSNTGLVESQTTYDANAMPWKAYAFGQLQQTLTYDTASSVTSGQRGTLKTSTDGKGNTTTYADWRRGLPQSIAFADGKTKSAVVGDLGTIASVQDENLYNTYYDYDAMGRLATIDYPNGDPVDWNNTTSDFIQVNSAEYGLPAGHWRQTVRTGNGVKATYYDGLWRPRLVREYDSGNLAGTIRSSLFCYDHDGRQTYASYPKGDVATVSCSLTGTRTVYDALGRATSVEQDSELGAPIATTTEYLSNSEGPYTKVTNPRGFVTRTWSQAFDQPGSGAPVAIQHPEGAYTDIVRDVFGKPKSITRRNSTSSVAIARQYVYSPEQRLCKRIEPETGATVLHYDAAGNLDWSASGLGYDSPAQCNEGSVTEGAKVKRTYDARNRIESLAFPDGRGNTNYTYTPDGLLATIAVDNGAGTANLVDEAALQGQVGLPAASEAWAGGGEVSDALPLTSINVVTTTYGYNRRRLPMSERVQWGALDWSLGYAYTSNGHLATLTYPDNHAVGYTPNALGQPTRAGDYATGVTYHPNGAMAGFSYGNGLTHTLTQNARGLPERSVDAYNGNARLDDSYDYDEHGNVAAISDATTGNRGDRTMTYDGLDRLTDVVSPMYGTTGAHYWYDVLDNLTRVHIGGTGFRNHYYCYDSATWRLTNVKTDSCAGTTVVGLGYDAQGNVINKNGTTYDYDTGNRMRHASVGNSEYIYDGHGRRVRDRTTASQYTQYSQSGQLLYGNDMRAGYWRDYVYLNGSLVAVREKAHSDGAVSLKYQHTDALGSPVAVTNEIRTVIEKNEYEPFGKVINHALKDGPGYTGHLADATTGLIYAQQRYYDDDIGAFPSVDPVTAESEGGTFNRYWYANNNPYKYTDPDGREVTCNGKTCTIQCDFGRNCGGDFAKYGAIRALNDLMTIQSLFLRPLIQRADSVEGAQDKLSEGKSPAEGADGRKGVLVGDGGREQAEGDFDNVDGAEIDTGKDGVRVKQLEGGGRVEIHDSTGKNPNVEKGTRTIKIQDENGKVKQTIRYPERKI